MTNLPGTKHLLLILFSFLFLASPPVNAQNIKMAFLGTDAIPFKWKNKNKNYEGPLIDIMQEISKRMKVKIKVNDFPPKRVLSQLKDGKILGAFGLSRTDEREEFTTYLDTAIGWTGTSLFIGKRKQLTFSKIEDLYGETVYAIRGLALGSQYHKAVQLGKIKENLVSDYQTLVKITSLRSIIAASPTAPFLKKAEKMGLANKIVKLSFPLRPTVSLHILFSKQAKFPRKKELIQQMDEVLMAMEKDGTIKKFYKNYGYRFDVR